MIATDGSEFMALLRSPFFGKCYKDLGGNGTQSNIQLPSLNMEDQPVLRPDGKLLDALQIEWFHDPDDPHPMQLTTIPQGTVSISFKLVMAQSFFRSMCACLVQNTNGA